MLFFVSFGFGYRIFDFSVSVSVFLEVKSRFRFWQKHRLTEFSVSVNRNIPSRKWHDFQHNLAHVWWVPSDLPERCGASRRRRVRRSRWREARAAAHCPRRAGGVAPAPRRAAAAPRCCCGAANCATPAPKHSCRWVSSGATQSPARHQTLNSRWWASRLVDPFNVSFQ